MRKARQARHAPGSGHRRGPLREARRPVPAVCSGRRRIYAGLKESIGDHVPHFLNCPVAAGNDAGSVLAFGHKGVHVELDGAAFDQLVDRGVDLGRETKHTGAELFVQRFLDPVPVDMQVHVVSRAQRKIIERVHDSNGRHLPLKRLFERCNSCRIQGDREDCLVFSIKRRMSALVNAEDEFRARDRHRGGARRRTRTAGRTPCGARSRTGFRRGWRGSSK